MSPIDHLDLVVTSLERSLAFPRGLDLVAEVRRLSERLAQLEQGRG